ncbi:MAG: hypothetical protein ACP5SG_04045 [Dissulfurimicrobium sp.]
MEIARLKRDLAQIRMERGILKSGCILCEGVAARYAVMKWMRLKYLFL